MTEASWLEAHPYLRPLAEVCARVERALTEIGVGTPVLEPLDSAFEAHRSDFLAGVPLLQREPPLLSLEPAGSLTAALVARLAGDSGTLGGEARALDEQLRREPEAGRRIADWLLGDEHFQPVSAGLLRFLGWTAAARYLAPATAAFERWRNVAGGAGGELDERWLRRYCPLCGSPPAMAQLVGADAGRKRLLACGACGSRWGYKRTKCPFCEADVERLSSMTAEGESGLRIDSCESCRGYVKTYDGQGNEGLLLADWTSLHLDLLAQDRGLKRMAASLYELDAAVAPG
ncbi:MAG TPA: formate dehydrogenase accessory protein FdhE [Thermoanaerobaculia bacterium]